MTPHLRGQVRAYVDRSLPPAVLHLYDKHLICCTLCRADADQERRIVASLRSDTSVPLSLRSSLIGLASSPPPMEAPNQPTVPRIPLPPMSLRMPSGASHAPVRTVRPTAPPQHRSPMRAAVVASIAAGASVAAAWGLAVSPLPSGRPSVAAPVASFGDAGLGVSSKSGATAFPVSRNAAAAGSGSSQPAASTASVVGRGSVGATAQTVADLAGSTAAVLGASAARPGAAGAYWVRRGANLTVFVAAVGPVSRTSPLLAPSGP
ncbi:MAG: hypothetical protein ABI336_07105 [Humibacillus sp.]